MAERRIVLLMGLVFVLAAGGAGWVLVWDRLLTVPAEGGRIIEAVVGTPKYPHPFYAGSNDPDLDLVALVYAGLFRRTDGSTITPDLAERFAWSDDGKILTLTLRTDARFHDGTPVTADDVVFTLSAAKDPTWKSPAILPLRNVAIERTDDHTVTLTLEQPDGNLLDILTLGILPAHIWQDIPPGSAHLSDATLWPVGAGPFRVRSSTRDARGTILAYTLERNNGYHGLKPYLDQLELRFFTDRTQAEEALQSGRVDTLAFVAGPDITSFTKHERWAASVIELPQETIAFFNVKDPLLKDLKIRQALTLAVERNDIVAAQAGIASPVSSPYPFSSLAVSSSTQEERMSQARQLLESAGWVLPADGGEIRTQKAGSTSSSTPGELTLTVHVPDVPDLIAVAEALQRHWSLLGARVSLDVQDPTVLARSAVNNRDAQILVWKVLLSPSQDQYPIWWSGEATGRGLNLSNLADRNVDDAIEAVRAATTTETLATARDTLSNAILARAPAAFLTRPGSGYVHSARLRGMAPTLQLGKPSDRFSDISNWYVKTAWRWR
jgi:peptide/nickel transport system substrate-binding protein